MVLLKSAISGRAALVTDLSEHLPAVKAHTAQLRQVLMNLVVNHFPPLRYNGQCRSDSRYNGARHSGPGPC